tara:strand:+ start:35 stop:370 length:336 start_codon:yes stop_codon:yes gene_type:complete
MPPLEVTIRPPPQPRTQLEKEMLEEREERRMLREKLDDELRKADKIDADVDKHPRTAESRRFLADMARRDARSAHWRAHRATIGRTRTGDRGTSTYLERNDGGIARKTRIF